MTTNGNTPDTIVPIHGFWVTPRSWEDWIAYYEGKGYRVLAPAYPGFEVEVEALNADPTLIEKVTVPQIVERLESVIGGSTSPDPDRGLGRRRVHAADARSRPRRSRRGHQLRTDGGGRQGRWAVADQVDLPGAEEPGQPPQGRRVHVRPVALRLHEHILGGGGTAAVRALPHPGVRPHLLGQRPRQHPSRQGRHVRRLQERRPRAAALHLRQPRPS